MAYDPFSVSVDTSATYDPMASNVSLNDTMERQSTPELRGAEASFAATNPNLYAFSRAAILDMIPFGRFALPSGRDEFERLDDEDKLTALAWEAVGLGLWGAAKYGKPLIGAAKAKFFPKYKVLPAEDAVAGISKLGDQLLVKEFAYEDQFVKTLAKRGFAADEAAAAWTAQHGNPRAMVDVLINRTFQGKGPTKAFNELTEFVPGAAYPQKRFVANLANELAEDTLRAKYYNDLYSEGLSKYVFKSKPTGDLVEGLFRKGMEKLYPEARNVGFGEATFEQVANVINYSLASRSKLWVSTYPGAGRFLPPSLLPARYVYGLGEKLFGTFSRVYEPIKGAMGAANKNYFNHMLLWNKMLEDVGLLEKVKITPTGEFKVKAAKAFTLDVSERAYGVARRVDDLLGKASRIERKTPEAANALREEAQRLLGALDTKDPAKLLLDAWYRYSDHLYSEYVHHQIPRVFRKAGLTDIGQRAVDNLSRKLAPQIDELFSSVSSKSYTEKVNGMKAILGQAQELLETAQGVAKHPYFTAEGKQLEDVAKRLGRQLTYKRGFMQYLENYAARMTSNQAQTIRAFREQLFGRRKAGFTKSRQLEAMIDPPVDFRSMIEGRTMAQARELFLYDKLEQVVTHAKGLPAQWVDYIEHHISGILGLPSETDARVASFLTRTAGAVERWFGRDGIWDGRRVNQLGHNINSLVYLGGLGFKPFSAIRNLFQPLLTVPADLGGVKDLGRLATGAKWAANADNRAWLIKIGAIADYAPEIHLRPAALPFGRRMLGKEVPRLDTMRDVGLFLFRGSDRWNRYVTGGAAATKWDAAMHKLGGGLAKGEIPDFVRRSGVAKRNPWVKAEIEDLLFRGKIDDAKALFVRDVVEDTQFAYGVVDAPMITRRHGAVSKTGFVFQTWWMNYGALLEKWMTTGASPGAAFERTATWMLSSAIAVGLMEQLWSKGSAKRGAFLGPFPGELSEFTIPPAWQPIYHSIAAILNLQTPEISSRHASKLLESAWMFTPGGLQISSSLRGAREEGWKGFAKSIIRYNPD